MMVFRRGKMMADASVLSNSPEAHDVVTVELRTHCEAAARRRWSSGRFTIVAAVGFCGEQQQQQQSSCTGPKRRIRVSIFFIVCQLSSSFLVLMIDCVICIEIT